jgi:Fe-S cluster biogenesis protein NfuA/nitrite reductase/ring-hydroxylating ferredoxin subunit
MAVVDSQREHETPEEEHAGTAGAGTEEIIGLVQELQERFERVEDSEAKRSGEALISALVQMYGGGLAHLVHLLGQSGEGSEHLRAALEADPLLSTLLLIHDLHPTTLDERVAEALEQVRPYMESHGGDVELLSLNDGVARIRLRGSCSDCAASSVTLELAIKQALEEAAPDLERLEVEGLSPPPESLGAVLPIYESGPTDADRQAPGEATAEASADGAVVLPMLGSSAPSAPTTVMPTWRELEDLAELRDGEMVGVEVADATLLVANVDGTLLAYRDRCAGCGAALRGGKLVDGALRCQECSRTFFLPRAGRSLDEERIQLEPVPLLSERGTVRVALAG